MSQAEKPLPRAWLFRVAIGATLIAGGALTAWRLLEADRRIRADLLQRATLVSWALRSDHVTKLAGHDSDRGTPRYERIKAQLEMTRGLLPDCRFLYLLRRSPDGQIRFLVDSEPSASEDFSPPGQHYAEAGAPFHEAFLKAHAQTVGPFRDRWGAWVTALVPLYHPTDDRLVAVLGMDMDARHWRAMILRAATPIPAFTLLFLALLVWGRRRIHLRTGPAWQRPDVCLAAGLGLLATALAVYLVRDGEQRRNREQFHARAALQSSLLQQFLFRIGDNYLESVARFMTSSDFVTREEFQEFTQFLLTRPYARHWGWIPAVRDAYRDQFERDVQGGGAPHFFIWEPGPGGERMPAQRREAYYPFCYLAPPDAFTNLLGFDQGVEPPRRDALMRALHSHTAEATDPVQVATPDGLLESIVVYRTVTLPGQPEPIGFVSVSLMPDVLLMRALSRESTKSETATEVDLYQVNPDGSVRFLTSNHDESIARHEHIQRFGGPLDPGLLIAPAYAFGKVYALASRPDPDYTGWYPPAHIRRSLLGGLLLTGLLTALVATLGNRRTALERLVAERTAELRASETSYHGLFNSIRQAIYIQDAEGRFLDVNDGAVAMYGYARADFIGRRPDFLSAEGLNDLDALRAAHARAWAGETQHFEFWGRRSSGEIFPKDVSLYKGSYFGQDVIIAVASDISDRKKAEQDKAKLQEQLQQSQKMESIGRLAGGVAHDFNNMLQAILGNTTLALEEAPAGPLAEYLQEIKRSTERSADLTRQLLAFASRQPVTPRVIDMNDTITGMLKMLRRLIGEDIQLQWIPGSSTWPVKVDPTQLDQILANLTVNARDAIAGAGSITIKTLNLSAADGLARSIYAGCPDGDFALLIVSDTGRGMDEGTLTHIFEPFYTTKADGKGTGLGLATVFGIVKQNNGFIDVKSAPGQGAVFTIGLPRTPLPIPDEAPAAPPANVWQGSETILLVEDEEAVLRFGAESLRRMGYQVLAAPRPDLALEMANQHAAAIDLLITDVVLPGMNGRELAQTLTALRPGLKCLFVSGYTADIIATRGILDEHVHFIQKPFSLETLATHIRALLDA